MKPRIRHAVRNLIATFPVDSPPMPAIDWLARIYSSNNQDANLADAREFAEKYEQEFLTDLRAEVSQLNRLGRFCPVEFNNSSENLLQGVAFIAPRDARDVKTQKKHRAQYKEYEAEIAQLDPGDFEALCAGLLATLGVDEPKLTPGSRDEGIDFYGHLSLESRILPKKLFSGVESQLKVWMVGQAKRYRTTQVSTSDIRNLVGAVDLAKGHAYGATDKKYQQLRLRVCDPVFYLFFTTGTISLDGWQLLERSGVVGMDGHMIAAFLADQKIGAVRGKYSRSMFVKWINVQKRSYAGFSTSR